MSTTPTGLESIALASAAERYLVDRYPYRDLLEIDVKGAQAQDQTLAHALYRWRVAAKWDDPEVIGESRCVSCAKLMGEESSAAADETVCHKCAGDDE